MINSSPLSNNNIGDDTCLTAVLFKGILLIVGYEFSDSTPDNVGYTTLQNVLSSHPL